jgi:hypothetical protein
MRILADQLIATANPPKTAMLPSAQHRKRKPFATERRMHVLTDA